jgi:hypothetical protein
MLDVYIRDYLGRFFYNLLDLFLFFIFSYVKLFKPFDCVLSHLEPLADLCELYSIFDLLDPLNELLHYLGLLRTLLYWVVLLAYHIFVRWDFAGLDLLIRDLIQVCVGEGQHPFLLFTVDLDQVVHVIVHVCNGLVQGLLLSL